MVFFKNYSMDPAMRQNFGDAHGQIFQVIRDAVIHTNTNTNTKSEKLRNLLVRYQKSELPPTLNNKYPPAPQSPYSLPVVLWEGLEGENPKNGKHFIHTKVEYPFKCMIFR